MVLRPQPTPVGGNNRAADGQSHPQAVGLGRDKRLKDMLQPLGIDTDTRIMNANLDGGRVRPGRANLDPARAASRSQHGFGPVQQQVKDYLLQLNRIASHPWQGGVEGHDERYLTGDQVAVDQFADLPNDRVDIQWLPLHLTFLEHGPHLTNHLAGPLSGRHDVRQDGVQIPHLQPAVRQQPLSRLRIAEDGGERLVKLVGERRREFPECHYPHHVRQFLALAQDFQLHLLALGDIDRGPQHAQWYCQLDRRGISGHHRGMNQATNPYAGYRYPAEIISHVVWLYFRFTLSFRDIEELLAARGITVTYETIRQWCLKFGQSFANEVRRRLPRPGDKWHLDEMYLKINGKLHYLWRAVDQESQVLDILLQTHRDKRAAKRFFKKLLKGLRYVPRVVVTDKLRSYGAALKEILPSVEHRQQKGLNNRAELSHQPTRQQERQMRRFKSAGQAQRFLSAHAPLNNLFRFRRHRLTAAAARTVRAQAFATWQQVTCVQQAA